MTVVLRILVALVLLVACHAGALTAQERAYSPKVGSPERNAVLEALRVAVRQEIKKTVVFKVDHLKVQDGWAFVRGVPQQSSGKPVDYRGTPYEKAIKGGYFDDKIAALMRKEQGRWTVIKYDLGATDVPYIDWDKEYQAPSAIFR
jgi:hypothetical protein